VDLTTTTGDASFTYTSPGEYQAQVVVEDNREASSMTSTSITVSPPPQVTNKGGHRGCGCGCTLAQATPVQDILSNFVPILLILFYVVRKKRSEVRLLKT